MSIKLGIIALISLTISFAGWVAVWLLYLPGLPWAAYVAATLWGAVWAACLQFTTWGRWLALYRTWLTVVLGVGMNLLILLNIIRAQWLVVFLVFALSSVGIIVRSLFNEYMTDAT